MAGGFRISESGDSRVSELGDSRITEELNFASASLTTSRGFYRLDEQLNERTDESGNLRVSQDFDSVVIFSQADLYLSGSISLSAGGGTISAGEVEQLSFSNLFADTTISVASTAEYSPNLSLTSTLSVDTSASLIASASFSGTSESSVSVDYSFIHGGLFTPDPEEEYQRETESGDIRVTENGDVRIVGDVLPNAAEGVLSSTYTYIAFSSTAYINYNGEWQQFTPTVNNNGSWEDPLAIYKKIDSQNWKRAY